MEDIEEEKNATSYVVGLENTNDPIWGVLIFHRLAELQQDALEGEEKMMLKPLKGR